MKWYKHNIETENDILAFITTFKQTKPQFTAFDTETNGLNIVLHEPFLLAFGFANVKKGIAYSYTIDFERHPELIEDTMYAMETLFNTVEKNIAWNTKFDLHMLHNIGYPNLFGDNLTDAMIYVRLAHDALAKSAGGVPMTLKGYATKYVDPNAKHMEREIKKWQENEKRKRSRTLREKLKRFELPEEFKVTGKELGWTVGVLEAFFKDKISEIKDLPTEIIPIVEQWLRDTPDPNNYQNINRKLITKYAHYDIIYTIESFLKVYNKAKERGQQKTIEREEKLIKPLYRMERVGFAFNTPYALETKEKLKNYIIELRNKLKHLAHEDVKAGQHQKLKKIFRSYYGLNLESTGQEILKTLNLKNHPKAQELVDTITELRTLEKWYSTYLIKWLEEESNGRVYTSIRQIGTVSGRVSSDFQQFPKGEIKDNKGNTLFIPRKLVKISGGSYKSIFYLDYSQIELRFQALYTILVNEGDTNLCRAYMPFKCKTKDGTKFDYKNKEHLNNFHKYDWYLEEEPNKKWHAVDLHSATTKNIFPGITEDDPKFKKYRAIGKMTNFACNYGATPNALAKQLDNNQELGKKAYEGYLKTFPKVQAYRDYVKKHIYEYGYAVNLFGRRYYNASPHNAQNYLVQGSAADFLKDKIIEADTFLMKNNYKSRFQMNIHDELSFEIHEDDPKDLPDKLKTIMEELEGTYIPIVADKEITHTTWDEKVEI